MAKQLSENKPAYPAEKARGGEIILRTRMRRIIFIAGLVGIVILVLAVRIALSF
jgi:hypothetical protein